MKRMAFHSLAVMAFAALIDCGASESPVGSDPVPAVPALPAVIFEDGTFDTGEWTAEDEQLGPGGTFTVRQETAGGNSGPFRQISLTLNSTVGSATAGQIAVFSFKNGATYTPSSQGAITSIDYSEDAILLVGGGAGHTSAPALKQSGIIYTLVLSDGAFGTGDASWIHHDTSGTRDRFRTLTSSTAHPDFSSSGTTIQFGFMRAISTPPGNVSATRTGGIDNWKVTINR